jgi:hypothetical protein
LNDEGAKVTIKKRLGQMLGTFLYISKREGECHPLIKRYPCDLIRHPERSEKLLVLRVILTPTAEGSSKVLILLLQIPLQHFAFGLCPLGSMPCLPQGICD